MKKSILSLVFIAAAALAVMAFSFPSGKNINPPQDKPAAFFPEDIQQILENSCYDCHSDAASNAKAKLKLNFSKWDEMTDSKKVGKLEGINEVIKSGDMPPGKYVTNHPEKALTDGQKELINRWITEKSAKLMNQ